MKRLILFIIITVIVSFQLHAQQTPPSLQWKKVNNGATNGSNDFIKSVQDVNGNIYQLSRTNNHYMVVRFNTSGGVTQTYEYNNWYNGGDYPNDLKVDNNGNVYVCGWSWITYDYFLNVVKFDPNGNLLWTYNENHGNWLYGKELEVKSIVLDNSNNVLFTGSLNDSLIVGKLNPSGNLIWLSKINVNGNYLGMGNDIVVDGSGSAFVTGYSGKKGSNPDAVTIKVASSGSLTWYKLQAGAISGDDYGSHIRIDNGSNVYVGLNVTDNGTTNYSPLLIKYNASGAQQWLKNYFVPAQSENRVSYLHTDVVGNSYIITHNITLPNVGESKLYKVNGFGTQTYSATVNDAGMSDNFITAASVDINGNLYYAGYNSAAWGNIFYGKLNSTGNSVFYNTYNFSGANNVGYTCGIHHDNSSNFNVCTRTVSGSSQLLDVRFNNTGVYQWEGIFNGSGNQHDENIRVITQANSSVYSLGSVENAGSGVDMLLSKYDNQGNIMWQNMIDDNSSYNNAYDFGADQDYNIYTLCAGSFGQILSKYDSIGLQLWTKNLNDGYRKTIVDAIGNSYLAGSAGYWSTTYTVFPVAKFDNAGNQIFQVQPPSVAGYKIEPQAMALDANNRMYVAGQKIYDPFGPAYKLSLTVQKFSPTGVLVWSRDINQVDSVSPSSLYSTLIKSVLVDNNNEVYVFGQSDGIGITGLNNEYSFVVKYSATGNLLWRKNYNTDGVTNWYEDAGEMILSSGNSLIAFASAWNYKGFLVRKIDRTNGSLIWESTHMGNGTFPYSLEETSNGDLYVCGRNFSIANLKGVQLEKFDSNGNFIWETSYNGDFVGDEEPTDMKVTNGGRIYISGKFFETAGISPDAALLKFCDINQPSLTSIGNFNGICPGTSVSLQANNGTAYAWNVAGQTDSTITVNTAGPYFCTVYKNDGCAKNTDTINVVIKSAPNVPQICLVTVDTMSMHNIVYWDKTSIVGADSFKVYREDVTNVYTHIATVDADSLSEYHDIGANPNVTTKRYKLSAIDSCGNESAMSNYHNTLYIVDNGNGQFSWNPLYTIENSANPVNNYVLMVDTNSTNNWIQASITAGTQNTLVDPNYNNYMNAQYRVETIWNITCSPTRGVINTTRSNIKSASRVGIPSQQAFNNSLSLMPNPAVSSINLNYTGKASDLIKIEVYDSKGQLVYSLDKPNSSSISINVESLNPGIYQMRITGIQGASIKRFVHN